MLKKLFTDEIVSLLKKLSIVLVFLMASRLVFYVANFDSFNAVSFYDFIIGAWFDCITVAICFMPFYVLFLIPFKAAIRNSKWYKLFFRILFNGLNATLLLFNIVDVEYFKFTSKRSTADLFAFMGQESDMSQLFLAFFKDFWILIIVFLVFIYFADLLYCKTEKVMQVIVNRSYFVDSIRYLIVLFLFIVVARGGFGLRPVGIIEASNYTRVENSALVLNTPFTIVKTYGKKALVLKDYMSLEEEEKLFNPIRTSHSANILPNKTNVVILILESFGEEFAGLESQNSFTPFFDSILENSLYFENAFSNGKKSIEAVPSILASIPTLMDNPYISSSYGDNKINSLPSILKEQGYASAFFHGATNGSMRFDGFANQVGFDYYFGRKEYGNEEHYDHTWGILDEYFNPWTAKKISSLPTPFMATLFTLSSHHPYYIPENRRGEFQKGPSPICASLGYSDDALRKFFKEAEKQPWFSNTLFVLCADHTPSTSSPYYSKRSQMYKIPIAFYYPKNKQFKKKEKAVFQQIDIMPTLLDLLNIEKKYYSFGTSFYSQNEDRKAFTFIEGVHYVFDEQNMFTFSNDKARNLYNHQSRKKYVQDSLQLYKKEGQVIEKKLKAIIQRYSRDLIQNQTTVK